MKMSEFTKIVESADGAYDRKSGLFDLYYDLLDNLEEGYIEGVSLIGNPRADRLEARCDDGTVIVTQGDGYKPVTTEKPDSVN